MYYFCSLYKYQNFIKEYGKHCVPTDPCHRSICHTVTSNQSAHWENTSMWQSVLPRDAVWRHVTRWPLNIASVTAVISTIVNTGTGQQPTQTLSTQGSPAYTSLYPQLILELIVPVVTSVNISSHWVGMYACTSECHPADLHHGDQVRYRQQCGDKINVWICLFRSNQVVETVCYCNTDLCNGAGLAENSVFMMIIFTLYTLNIIMQWIIAWLIVHSRHGYSAFKLGWVRIPTFNVFHTQMFNWLHFLVIKYN